MMHASLALCRRKGPFFRTTIARRNCRYFRSSQSQSNGMCSGEPKSNDHPRPNLPIAVDASRLPRRAVEIPHDSFRDSP